MLKPMPRAACLDGLNGSGYGLAPVISRVPDCGSLVCVDVAVGRGVMVFVAVANAVCVYVCVFVGVEVCVSVDVCVGVPVGVFVGVKVIVCVYVNVFVPVGDAQALKIASPNALVSSQLFGVPFQVRTPLRVGPHVSL